MPASIEDQDIQGGEIDNHTRHTARWLARYLAPLKGATIAEVEIFVEDGDAWPRLLVEIPGEDEPVRVEVSRDEEGNGPGFLLGLADATWRVVEDPEDGDPGFYAADGRLRAGPYSTKKLAQGCANLENAMSAGVPILEDGADDE